METMTSKDAMMFPIVGSCVLFGLFLLFKVFAKEYLNMLFTFYFLLIGLFAVAMTILPTIQVSPQSPTPHNPTEPNQGWGCSRAGAAALPCWRHKTSPATVANKTMCGNHRRS